VATTRVSRPFGGGVIGNTPGSGPGIEGSSPSPRACVTSQVTDVGGSASWRAVSRRSVLAVGAAALVGCSGPSRRAGPQLPTKGGGQGRPVTIGVVAPFSGPRAYVGQMVSASLSAAAGYIDHDLHGSLNGYRPVLVTADAPLTGADGQRAYSRLAGLKVDAVLWCGAPGLPDALPDIVRDLRPVIAVATDLQSRATSNPEVPDMTGPAAAGLPVFQTAIPDAQAMDLLADYLHTSRGFTTSFLVYSKTDFPGADAVFAAACATHGVQVVGTYGFDTAPDFPTAVQQARRAGAQSVMVFALPEDSAAVVDALDRAGARYVDTASARTAFKPMVVGAPVGVGDGAFMQLAGRHAAPGTMSVEALREFVGLPDVPIRGWLARYAPSYAVRGGEVGPADALGAILTAVARAQSVAGADVVAALESGVQTQFASVVPFGFRADRHIATAKADLVLTTVEYQDETRYKPGLSSTQQGPNLFVDFNFSGTADLTTQVLAKQYGTSCRAEYQGGDAAKAAACRSVH
jgi:ABC-type branched-subunit amino acid transport system substrate-binding protein